MSQEFHNIINYPYLIKEIEDHGCRNKYTTVPVLEKQIKIDDRIHKYVSTYYTIKNQYSHPTIKVTDNIIYGVDYQGFYIQNKNKFFHMNQFDKVFSHNTVLYLNKIKDVLLFKDAILNKRFLYAKRRRSYAFTNQAS